MEAVYGAATTIWPFEYSKKGREWVANLCFFIHILHYWHTYTCIHTYKRQQAPSAHYTINGITVIHPPSLLSHTLATDVSSFAFLRNAFLSQCSFTLFLAHSLCIYLTLTHQQTKQTVCLAYCPFVFSSSSVMAIKCVWVCLLVCKFASACSRFHSIFLGATL